MYTHEDIITSIVMFSKVLIPETIEFWFKLGFNPYYYRSFSNEQLVISKIIKLLARKIMLSQHSIIRYHIDFYFPKYKAIELDKKRSKKVTLTEWTKRNKKTRSNKKNLGCEFISINPDKKDFDTYV